MAASEMKNPVAYFAARCSVAPLTFMLAIWQSAGVAAQELLLLLSCCQCNRILICHVGWDVLSPMRMRCCQTQTPRHLLATVVVTIFVAIYVDVLLSSILACLPLPTSLPSSLLHTHLRTSLASASSRQGRAGRELLD